MSHNILWCPMTSIDVPWHPTVSNDIIWCPMTTYDIPWGLLMSYDIPWCSMMSYDRDMIYHDVIWCPMMSHDLIWCPRTSYDVPMTSTNCAVISHEVLFNQGFPKWGNFAGLPCYSWTPALTGLSPITSYFYKVPWCHVKGEGKIVGRIKRKNL